MDNFWKWLKKANARAVFFCLLIALIGVAVWWTWKLMTPIQVARQTSAGMGSEPAFPGLGMLAFLEAQRAAGTNRAANLFFPEASIQVVTTIPTTEPAETIKPEEIATTVKTVPPRPKKFVTLTYRGMYVRGDGTPMALIEDSKTKHASFYPVGTNLFGLNLKTVKAETLGVNLEDGSDSDLKRGVPQTFPEGRHAD